MQVQPITRDCLPELFSHFTAQWSPSQHHGYAPLCAALPGLPVIATVGLPSGMINTSDGYFAFDRGPEQSEGVFNKTKNATFFKTQH